MIRIGTNHVVHAIRTFTYWIVHRCRPGLLIIAAVSVISGTAGTQTKTTVELILGNTMAKPGDTVYAAVVLTSQEGWHTYWRNPGESGAATVIEWQTPDGIVPGEMMWPPPEEHIAAGLTTYVYHGKTALITPLKISSEMLPGTYQITARVSWLECKEECVPGDATAVGSLEVGREQRPSPQADQINQWLKLIPERLSKHGVSSFWRKQHPNEPVQLVITLPNNTIFEPVNFLTYPMEGVEILPSVRRETDENGQVLLVKSVKLYRPDLPKSVTGILWRPTEGSQNPSAIEIELTPKLDPVQASNAAAPPIQENTKTIAGTVASAMELISMIGLAFLGGIILNFMPCVLPVISIKILGFVQQSRNSPRELRRMGWLYGLGVLCSFLFLAAVVILVKTAGGAVSWGMHMQNPQFRLVLLVVVTMVSLNLFGVFEVRPASPISAAALSISQKKGYLGAFLNGVLATALATPCTAPFLATAAGFAFAQSSPLVIALIFVSVALGLSAPYVMLSLRPGWLRLIPKPGTWMEKFKTAMGFPMLATGIWLFDLTAPSFGKGGVLWLGLFLVTLALGTWAWGSFIQKAEGRTRTAGALIVACCVALAVAVLEGPLDWRHPHTSLSTPIEEPSKTIDRIDWQPWSSDAVEKARSEGKPVIVDFTAKWCLTCQSNEKLAIEVPEVRKKLRETGTVAFKADYTDPNPAIAAELKKHGRAGVPLVVVYPRQTNLAPMVLPTVLTPSIVLKALDIAGK